MMSRSDSSRPTRAALAASILGVVASGASLAAGRAATAGNDGRLADLSLEQLMEIEVISVSRTPEPLSEAASAIQVVFGEEIRRSGAATLPQALRLADNLAVAQKNSHDWAITARGFNTALANKLLVLLDGRSVYTPLFSGVFWNVQDVLLEDVDRIEVISGPGGSVWGANAVNGVINVRSKPASETQGTFAQIGSGNQLDSLVNVRHGGTLGETAHFRIYGKLQRRDSERLAGGGAAGDAWDRGATGFRVDGDRPGFGSWTLQGDFYDGDDGLPEGGVARVRGGNLLTRWKRPGRRGSELAVQAYTDRTSLRLPVPELVINGLPLAPAGTLRDELRTYDFDLQHRLATDVRHRITWGAGFRYWSSRVDNAPALGFLPRRRDQRLWSLFAQDEIRLGTDLDLTIGTKVEHTDTVGIEFEPSVRLAWRPREAATLWAAVSRAVRTPSRIDRELAQPPPPHLTLLVGNPEFDSESVVSAEAGARGVLSRRATGSASVFYNRWRSLRSTSVTPGTILPFFFENQLEGDSYGLELRGQVQCTGRLRLTAGYTYLEHDLTVRSGGFDFNDARNETADPEQQVALRAALDVGRNLSADAALRWVDRLDVNNGPTVGSVPSYFELDLRIGWHPTAALEVELVGSNLLHDEHPEYGFPGPDRVEIRRSVGGRLTWRR